VTAALVFAAATLALAAAGLAFVAVLAADLVTLAPAALALAEIADFRLAAVFLCTYVLLDHFIKLRLQFFLGFFDYRLASLASRLALKAFRRSLRRARFSIRLRARRFSAWRTRFLADLIIGTVFFLLNL
jgi:hypothetical protein